MLITLRRIVQEVNTASNLTQGLDIITTRVKQVMGTDVCSVYLFDAEKNQYVLMASKGLKSSAIGAVSLSMNEGLVGVVGSTEDLVNLEDAALDPKYRYFAETGEESFHGFLGVPIIHHREVMGVLVVQQRTTRCFYENEASFLLTIAAQLAGAIAHAKASGEINLNQQDVTDKRRPLKGLSGAPGIAIGTAVVNYPMEELKQVPDRHVSDTEAEGQLFQKALQATRKDILTHKKSMSRMLGDEDLALFDAYLLMLESQGLLDKIMDRIRAGNWAAGALRETIEEHASVFEEMEDAYLQERANDVRDLGQRLLLHIQGKGQRDDIAYPEDTILVGKDISVTMLTEVPPERLKGVVSATGTSVSHVAILAHALGVPAILGVDELPVTKMEGCLLVVDGYEAKVVISPAATVLDEYKRLAHEEYELNEGLKDLKELPAITTDGHQLSLMVNTGLLADIAPSLNSGAEGVGLYRTEVPFMMRDSFPGEQQQRLIYRRVLEVFHPNPVVLRTLDVGGDKPLSYFPINEDNPFLGWRGIRISLDHPEIFLVQLRAMLRASIGLDNMSLLLPMISNVAEVDETLTLLHRVHGELCASGEVVHLPQVGVMIEVPSAVYMLDALARRVDFFSVGTNDLTQYMLAVDRNNARVAHLYDHLHPSVIRVLQQVVEAGRRNNKPVSVCGEMAGDPAAVLLLIGLGIESLSMSGASLPGVKWVIRSFSRERARAILHEALKCEDAQSIRLYLEKVLDEAGLGGLIRGGKK